MAVNGLFRAGLRTIAARQLWDGRRAAPRRIAIPGVWDFQRGVRAMRTAAASGDRDVAERLAEIDAAMDAARRSLGRWRRGLAAFEAESVAVAATNGNRTRWLGATRLIAVRAPETRRLARLIVDYDALCALAVAATAAAREAGAFNSHHAGIREYKRRIRAVVHAGHAGGAVVREGARRSDAGPA